MLDRRWIGAAALVALAGLAPHAAAEDLAVGIRAATTGLGLELTKAIKRQLNVRFGGNLLNYTYDVNWDLSKADVGENVDFDIKLKLRSASLMLDYLPSKRGFRVSAGLLYNRNNVLGVGTGHGWITINDSEYHWSEVQQLEAEAPLGRRLAPYVGFGFGNAVGGIGNEVTVTFDVGVVFQGPPSVTLRAVGPPSVSPALQEDLDAVAEEVADSDLKAFEYYPVVSLGIALRLN